MKIASRFFGRRFFRREQARLTKHRVLCGKVRRNCLLERKFQGKERKAAAPIEVWPCESLPRRRVCRKIFAGSPVKRGFLGGVNRKVKHTPFVCERRPIFPSKRTLCLLSPAREKVGLRSKNFLPVWCISPPVTACAVPAPSSEGAAGRPVCGPYGNVATFTAPKASLYAREAFGRPQGSPLHGCPQVRL